MMWLSPAGAVRSWRYDETKLTASDATTSDKFGHAVAASGGTIVVGALFGGGAVTDSGAAYVYAPDGAGGHTETKLVASDGAADDLYGHAVGVSGSTVVIAARNDDDGAADSGSAYVYSPNGSGGYDEVKLTASDGATKDWFGHSVAISGSTIVVGSILNDHDGFNSGAANIYTPNGSGGYDELKLTPSDGSPDKAFGRAVAISGSTIVVGSSDSTNGLGAGAVYVYTPDGIGGYDETKLLASDGAAIDSFGNTIAISGDTVVVGASGDDDLGAESGSAYVYTPDGLGGYSETKLQASDGAAGDRFGGTVTLAGDEIVVSAYFDDDKGTDSGSVYVYTPDGLGSYVETKLNGSDTAALDMYGNSLASDGEAVVVGAHHDDDGGTKSGSVYLYQVRPTGYSESQQLASDAVAGDHFGGGVAMDGDRMVIGAPSRDDNGPASGAAYVYTPGGGAAPIETKLLASDGTVDDNFGHSVAVSGATVVVGSAATGPDGRGAGAAYVYTPDGIGGYSEVKLVAPDGASDDGFGS
ncbi:MAG: hypothetical protein GY925_07205, partial [Actinomycetia bacterium]|nr:hypothetical protein [Actinomycetes bacterium]